MSLLKLLTKLTNDGERKNSAKELAQYLNAEDLIIFIEDPNIPIYLPAPGFPQVLKNVKLWEDFLHSGNKPIHNGLIAFLDNKPAVAVYSGKCVVVMIGGNPSNEFIKQLSEILPFIEALFIQEQLSTNTIGVAKMALNSAKKSERLATALDHSRKEITSILQENIQLIHLA